MSCATENAALKQELSRSQDTIQRLMAQEAVSAESISSLEHELDAKMDQIDELKGQVMSSLLKNREVTLEVEAAQNEVRDKEQELRSMQNYIASLESDGGRGGEGDGQGSFFLAENERLAAEGERSAVWCLYETRLVFVMRVMLCEHGVSDHFLTTFDQLIIQTNGEWNPNIRLLKFKSDWNS
jgi:hypothetical protein